MNEIIEKTYNDVINDIKQDISKTQMDMMINMNVRKWYVENCLNEGWSKSILIGVSEYRIFDKLPTDYMKNLPTNEDLNIFIDIDK